MAKATLRQTAFAKNVPDKWLPVVGETVVVRRTSGNLSYIRSVGTVISGTLFDDLYAVTIVRGRQRVTCEWWLSDLRPLPAAKS